MCGRFAATRDAEELAEEFSVRVALRLETPPEPSFNIAPTQSIYVIANTSSGRTVGTMKWGLVPPFAKDTTVGVRMINARAEDAAEKPSYKRALQKQRCIIPVDGYYEWQKTEQGAAKLPWFVESVDPGSSLALAGLWEVWREPNTTAGEKPLVTCTIMTTQANEDIAPMHHRMPIVLTAEELDEWMDPANDSRAVARLLQSPGPGRLQRHRVSTDVNNVKNDGPELVDLFTD